MVRSSTRDSCTNQSECRSTQEEGGATESCTNHSGGRVQTGQERQQTAADPHKKGAGPENCPPIAKMSTQVSKEEEEMQGEAWDCREEGPKQRRQPQPALGLL